MAGQILQALKALVTRVPWYKVPQFLAWVANFMKVAAGYIPTYGSKILAFIKANPGKIVTWFLNGYSAWEVLRMVLAYFGISI